MNKCVNPWCTLTVSADDRHCLRIGLNNSLICITQSFRYIVHTSPIFLISQPTKQQRTKRTMTGDVAATSTLTRSLLATCWLFAAQAACDRRDAGCCCLYETVPPPTVVSQPTTGHDAGLGHRTGGERIHLEITTNQQSVCWTNGDWNPRNKTRHWCKKSGLNSDIVLILKHNILGNTWSSKQSLEMLKRSHGKSISNTVKLSNIWPTIIRECF